MKKSILLFGIAFMISACATPIVEYHSTITVDGETYQVQLVSFEGGLLSVPSNTRNFAGTYTSRDYYQVVVNGEAYRCFGGSANCPETVRRALREQAEDEDAEESEESDGGGGGYSPPD